MDISILSNSYTELEAKKPHAEATDILVGCPATARKNTHGFFRNGAQQKWRTVSK